MPIPTKNLLSLNKAYRADMANSDQRLIRLIWLMLFIKADVPDMAIGIYLSKSK